MKLVLTLLLCVLCSPGRAISPAFAQPVVMGSGHNVASYFLPDLLGLPVGSNPDSNSVNAAAYDSSGTKWQLLATESSIPTNVFTYSIVSTTNYSRFTRPWVVNGRLMFQPNNGLTVQCPNWTNESITMIWPHSASDHYSSVALKLIYSHGLNRNGQRTDVFQIECTNNRGEVVPNVQGEGSASSHFEIETCTNGGSCVYSTPVNFLTNSPVEYDSIWNYSNSVCLVGWSRNPTNYGTLLGMTGPVDISGPDPTMTNVGIKIKYLGSYQSLGAGTSSNYMGPLLVWTNDDLVAGQTDITNFGR